MFEHEAKFFCLLSSRIPPQSQAEEGKRQAQNAFQSPGQAQALAEEHRRLREAAAAAATAGAGQQTQQHGSGAVPWGKGGGGGGGGGGGNKAAPSLLEIQQEEARVAKQQQQGEGLDFFFLWLEFVDISGLVVGILIGWFGGYV